jgi:DNA-binding ferritin-like protein
LTDTLQDVIEETESVEDRTTTNLLDDVKDGLDDNQWMLKAWEAT